MPQQPDDMPQQADNGPGRLWDRLGERFSAVRVLSSDLSSWLDSSPTASASVRSRSGVLEHGDLDGTYMERQLLFDGVDAAPFMGAGGYRPFRLSEIDVPPRLLAAMLSVRDRIASARFGSDWASRVRPLSIQPTRMQPNADRGDHNDLRRQGTFIGSYTAQGSCLIRMCYTREEITAGVPPDDAPRSAVSPHLPQLVRRQNVGYFYTMDGPSLEQGIYHGVRAGPEGRISLTFRFELL